MTGRQKMRFQLTQQYQDLITPPPQKKTAPHLGFLKCHIANFAFFPTETDVSVEIPAFLAVSEHFDAIFMLLEQH